MIGTFLRLLWRLFIGLLTLVLAHFTLFLFFPYLRNRFPLFITLIILYILIAYFGIPLLVRLWRFVIRPNHLPQYAVTGDGWSSDPVNIAIVCRNEAELRKAMEKAGWQIADKATLKNSLREAWAILFKRSYPTAPFSKLYLFGRKQDIGFQIQTGSPPSPRHRHHIRLWQLTGEPEKPHHHTNFWQDILDLFFTRKRQIWIGTATHDVGPFALRIQNLQITHKIDAETNKERDFVIASLENVKLVKRCETIAAGDPVIFRGQTFGLSIITDGTLKVVELKHSKVN
ncbi:MAG TPA: LssY C-terminal domain-containing protein [Candidatus Saccharimonadales bacterium]|nr:LssY C-terminal domain-containing protein [Candidatus Saccharimonadales bacterium]